MSQLGKYSRFRIFNTTQSSSVSTGALIVDGGTGVKGNLTVSGTLSLTNTTVSSSNTTGALTVAGGLGVTGAIYASGNVYSNGVRLATISEVGSTYTGGTNISVVGTTISTVSNPTFSGAVAITDTTASSSVTTGALTVGGGLGVSGLINSPSVALANSDVLILEDQSQTTVNTATLSGSSTFVTGGSSGYIQLTPAGTANQTGYAYWQLNPGTAWTLKFEFFYTSSAGADLMQFFAYQTSLPGNRGNNGGISIVLDEYTNNIVYMPATATSTASGSAVTYYSGTYDTTFAGNVWHTVVITYNMGYVRMIINGTVVLTQQTTLPAFTSTQGLYFGFIGYEGSITNAHRIRNIYLTKGIGKSLPTFPLSNNSFEVLDAPSSTTFANQLVVKGTGTTGFIINYNTDTTGNDIGFFDFRKNNTVVGNIAVNDATAGVPLEINSFVSNGVTIASGGGNVGIGSLPSGTYKLLVSGTMQVSDGATTASTSTTTGSLVINGGLGVGGQVTASTVSATTLTGTLSTASQTNITSVGTLLNLNVTTQISARNFVSGFTSFSGSPTDGILINLSNFTMNDTFGTSRTLSYVSTQSVAVPTLQATNPQTYTRAATLHVLGAPIASTNVTIGTNRALHVESGVSEFGGTLFVSNTTEASSSTVAAMTVAGGLGVSKALITSGTIDFNGINDSTTGWIGNIQIYSNFSGTSASYIQVGGSSRASSSWQKLMFGPVNQTSSYFTIDSATVTVPQTTTSSSTTTGALVVGGGLGVAGQVTATTVSATTLTGTLSTAAQTAITSVGTLTGLTSSGVVNVTNTTDSSLATNGAIVTAGGLGVGKATTLGGLLNVNYSGIQGGTPQLRVAPASNGAESSIGFYQNTQNAGSLWVIGHNTNSLGSNTLGIYSSSLGANVMKFLPTGQISLMSQTVGSSTANVGGGNRLDLPAYTFTINTAASGTLSNWYATYHGSPTITATNTAVTTTNAATLYIAGAPIAGTNNTITNSYAMHVASGTSRFDGIVSIQNNTASTTTTSGALTITGGLGIGGQITAGGAFTSVTAQTAAVAGSSAGQFNSVPTGTFTYSGATTGTLGAWYGTFYGTPTLAATSAGVTTTTAANVYIGGAPKSGTNNTITNAYGLFVDGLATNTSGSYPVLVTNASSGSAFTSTLLLENTTGGAGAAVGIDMVTYGGSRAIPTASIRAVDNGNFTNDIVFYTKLAGSASNAQTERMRMTGYGRILLMPSNVTGPTNIAAGSIFSMAANTYTYDTSVAASGTVSNWYGMYLSTPIIAATNTGVTTTNAVSLYIAGSPSAGLNNTITNLYALQVASGTSRFDGLISNTITTDSSATTNGAIVTAGGLGVGRSLFVGSAADFTGITGSVTVKMGGLQIFSNHATGFSYLQSGDAARTTNSWTPIKFAPWQSTTSYFTIDSASITVPQTTVSSSTTTGALIVGGGLGVAGQVTAATVSATTLTGTLSTAAQTSITSVGTLTGLTSSGAVNITNNTASTTTSTGALTVAGGIGVIGQVTAATVSATTLTGTLSTAAQTNITSVGTLTGLSSSGIVAITNTTASTSTTTGALTVAGGLGLSGRLSTATNVYHYYTGGSPGGLMRFINTGSDSSELSMGFYRNGDMSSTVNGDYFVMGLNSWSAGDRVFGIGASGGGLIISINGGNADTTFNLGKVILSNTTATTSTTTGALQVAGGLGLGGSVTVGNYVRTYQTSQTGSVSAFGQAFHVSGNTFTNSGTAASGTVANYFHAIVNNPIIAATNTNVTTTNATTLYIGGAPTAGTNNTITNAYSLWIASGLARLDGLVSIVNTTVSSSTTTGALTVAGGLGVAGQVTAASFSSTGSFSTSGQTVITNTSASTSETTGALVVSGGIGARGVLSLRSGAGDTSPGIRVAPSTDGNETSIGFYRYANYTFPATGDLWVLGQNVGGYGVQNWALYTNGTGNVLQASKAGSISMPISIASTNTTSGTLVVSGGAGIAGSINVGGGASFALSNNAGSSGATGALMYVGGSTYTNNATAASGTVGTWYGTYFATPTLAATNTNVTTTEAATIAILGPPAAGTNQTLTNRYSMIIGGNSVNSAGSYPLLITNSNSGAYTPALLLENAGGSLGAATGIDMVTYPTSRDKPNVSIRSVDMNNYFSDLAIYIKVGGAIGNAVTERLRLTSGGTLQLFRSAISQVPISTGNLIDVPAGTYTNTSTAAAGTLASWYNTYLGVTTLAATNTGVTTTNAATLYIAGAPAAGTNNTITNRYSMYVAGGAAVINDLTMIDRTGSSLFRSNGLTVTTNTATWAANSDVLDANRHLSLIASTANHAVTLTMRNTTASSFWDITAESASNNRLAFSTVGTPTKTWLTIQGSDGQVNLFGTTASSSTSTGSLIVAGGLGVAGQVTATTVSATTLTGTLSTASQTNVTSLGTLTGLTSSGVVSITNTTDAATQASGALTIAGGLGMSGRLTLRSAAGIPQIRVANTTTGNESSIGFTRTNDFSSTVAGDVWVLGQNVGGIGGGSFGIYTNVTTNVLTISPGGVVNIPIATASTSTGTGSLVVAGGLGVAGQVTASTVSATTLTGTLSTAAQTNVTSLGTLTGLTSSGVVNITNTTTSTSAGAGALVVAGGIYSGKLFIKDTLYTINMAPVTSGAENSMAWYRNNDYTATVAGDRWVFGIGVGGSGDRNFALWTNSTFNVITFSSAGVVNIPVATASTSTSTGSLTIAGGLGVAGQVTAGTVSATTLVGTLSTAAQTSITSLGTLTGLTVSGITSITNTTDASGGVTGTGALQVAGGLSVAKKMNVGTNLHVLGTLFGNGGVLTVGDGLSVQATTAATSTTTGALVVSGGIGTGGRVYATGGYQTVTAQTGAPAGTAVGQFLQQPTGTFTYSSAQSGTLAQWTAQYIGTPTLAAANAGVTTTLAANLYIAGAPKAGTNNTITSSYALYVDGNSLAATGGSYPVLITNSVGSSAFAPTLLLENNYGGQNAAVGIDMVTYNSSRALPSASIRAIDMGAYSSDIVMYTKVPGSIGNALAERMRINGYGRTVVGVSPITSAPNPGAGNTFQLSATAFTYDTSVAASGTVTDWYGTYIAAPTVNATNTGVTTTEAANLYIAGAPVAGTNNTFGTFGGASNSWSVYVANGRSIFKDYLYVLEDGAGGSIRVAPTTSGNESSIGFYRYNTYNSTVAGDSWVIGQNTGIVGAGNFGIWTYTTGAVLSISSAGVVNVISTTASSSTTTGALTVGGGLGVAGQVTATTVSATTLTGTLSTAAQTNVTSLGTLTGLTSSGAVVITNTTASTTTGTGALRVSGGIGVVGQVTAATVSATTLTGTLSTAAQTNITSLGTLTGLTSSGIVSVTNTTASSTTANGALTVAGGLGVAGQVTAGTVSATTLTGTLSTAAQTNVTSLGTLTGLTSSGVVTITNTTVSSTTTNGALTVAGGLGVAGQVTAATVSATTITGTLSTAAQTNVTSLGTLTGLTSSGAVVVTNTTASSSTTTGALRVSGGLGLTGDLYMGSNLVLNNTVGNSNLPALTINGGGGAGNTLSINLSPYSGRTGGVGVKLDAIDDGAYGAYFSLKVASASGTTTASEILSAYTNRVNIVATTASTSTSSGALIVSGGMGIAGALYGTSATFSGTITGTLGTANQTNITSVGTLTGLTSSGIIAITNTTDSSSTTTGALVVAGGGGFGGNVTAGNLTTTGDVFLTATTNRIKMNGTRSIWLACASGDSAGDFHIWDNTSSRRVLGYYFTANQIILGSVAGTIATIVSGTAAASSKTTGALQVAGGAGISGDLYATNINASGNLAGTLTTAAQTGITSLGTLTGLTSSGVVSVTNTTASSTTANGALTVAGGLGVAGQVTAATVSATTLTGTLSIAAQTNVTSLGTLTGLAVSGTASFTNTTEASSTTTGSVTFAGGIGVSKRLFIAGDIVYPTSGKIITNTVDESDTGSISISGGGDAQQTRGAFIQLFGQQHATNPGQLNLGSTTIAGSINLSTAGTTRMTINLAGDVSILNNTASSSTSSGALTISGGIGVAKEGVFGGQGRFVSGGTLFTESGTALKLTTGTTFGVHLSIDASSLSGGKNWLIYSTGGTADEGAGKLIFMNVTDSNTNYVSYASDLTMTTPGAIIVTNATASTSTGTGALTVAGGLGVAGQVTAATVSATTLTGTLSTAAQTNVTSLGTLTGLTSSGAVSITNTTASTSTNTGALIVAGGAGVGGRLNVGNKLSATYTPTGGTDPVLAITSNATINQILGGFLAPSLATSNNAQLNFGVSYASLNSGYIGFNYVGSGSTSNFVGIGLGSVDNIFNVFGNSNVAIGTTTAPSTKFYVAGTSTFTGNAAFTSGTASTTTGTGAITITGGLGVSGQVTAGTVSATTLTGTLSTAAQTNITSLGTLTGLTVSGVVNITNTTASTSGGAGALQVAGGIYSGGSLYAGNIYSNGVQITPSGSSSFSTPITTTNTTDSSSTTTGSLTVAGGAGIAKQLTANSILSNISVKMFQGPQTGTVATYGNIIDVGGNTWTNSGTAASGTLANYFHTFIGAPTIAASNTGVTTTNAYTFYVSGNPAAGTNNTITNSYAMYIAGGSSRIDGTLTIQTGSVPNLRVSPSSTGGESSIGYFSDVNASGSGSWYVGHNVGGIGSGNFGFYTGGRTVMSMTSAPIMTLTNTTGNSNRPQIKLQNSGGGGNNYVGMVMTPWTGRTGGDSAGIFGWDDSSEGAYVTLWSATSTNSWIECLRASAKSYVGTTLGGYVNVGTLSKAGGSFNIKHPDPQKAAQGYRLRHCFVESPTGGDNIYTYTKSSIDKHIVFTLPDYYRFLNGDSKVFITAVDVMGFGRGTVVITESEARVECEVSADGTYNIMIIGSRIDEWAQENWYNKYDGKAEYVGEEDPNAERIIPTSEA